MEAIMYDGKYIKLHDYLKHMDQEVEEITLTCRQIEEILQFKLPASACKYPAWWANEQEGSHTHSRSWRYAGWKTSSVKVGDKITFVREQQQERAFLFPICYNGSNEEAGRMATIFDVANYFRSRVDYEAGDNITPLKLQKLCYYAQAWHATWNQGERLFEEEFEHWDHGPANYALFDKYRDYKWQPIDPADLEEFDPAETFSLQQLESLGEVWEAYGDYTAKRLENLTHQEDPWLHTATNETITVESMVEYYSQLTED